MLPTNRSYSIADVPLNPILKHWLVLFLATVSLAAPTVAHAWGSEGHRIVAMIAAKQLPPEVRQKIDALLAQDDRKDLVSAATWADDIVPQRPDTEAWHFAYIPVDQPAFDAARDCTANLCLVAQIQRWRNALAVADAPAAQRADALKFLVSLVADAHQPLHTACRPLAPLRRFPSPAVACGSNRHGDRGADETKIRFGDLGVSLHHAWDHEMFYGLTGTLQQIADRLSSEITPDQKVAWEAGTVEDWVNESHRLAQTVAYGLLPNGQRVVIPFRYEAEARKTVELQMKRAGVRLAAMLNEVLK